MNPPPQEVVSTPVKPGFRTTEFWIVLFVVLGGMLKAEFGEANTTVRFVGILAAALAAMGYSVARTAAKKPAPLPPIEVQK